MQIDYFAIIKKAYHITLRQPGLWLLGLFLAGGFNANFLYLAQLQIGWRDRWSVLQPLLPSVTAGPIAAFSAITVGVFIVVIIVANWAKILFVLHSSDVLKLTRFNAVAGEQNIDRSLPQLFKQSLHYLPSVVAVSLLIMISVTIITGILFGTPVLLYLHLDSQPVMWLLSGLLFLVLILFFSCLNIFSTFFIVMFRYGAQKSLNLALDLIVSRWKNIASMAVMLMVIYALCFFVGSSVIYFFIKAAKEVWLPLADLGVATNGSTLSFIVLLSGGLLWVWLAVVNVFFNLSLLLLFAELVKPTKHGELEARETEPQIVGT